MKDLVIIGAGGFGREVSLLVEDINKSMQVEKRWNLLGFIDKDQSKWAIKFRGYPVLGDRGALTELPKNVFAFCAVSNPEHKKKLVEAVSEQEQQFATLVHPKIELTDDIMIGKGVLINKGCLLTININIGNHVSINPGCGVGHDAVIGDYTTLMWRVNISGAVQVGEGCMIGSGATVLQGKTIGAGSIIGAGAVVTKDIPAGCTAVGVPAQIIKNNSPDDLT